MQEFDDDLRNGIYFDGATPDYQVRCVEWQVRNYPHTHQVAKLVNADGSDVNVFDFISAEIPIIDEGSTEQDRLLHYLVCRYMIHKNNGHVCTVNSNGREPCRDPCSVICSHGFPKPLSEENRVDGRGFPIYRRRRPCDRFVVPYYSKALLKMWCHQNWEYVADATMPRYLYKYVRKPPLNTTVEISGDVSEGVDEVQDMIQMRYVGASQAHWKFLGKKRFSCTPPVHELDCHLPGRDEVIFNPETGESESRMSTLLLYFARPLEFFSCTYEDYFTTHTIPKCSRQGLDDLDMSRCESYDGGNWHRNGYGVVVKERQRGESECRITVVPHSSGDAFFLRLILLKQPVIDYKDAMSYNGETFDTFRSSAIARGLFSEDREIDVVWECALELNLNPKPMRCLLVTVAMEGGDALAKLEAHWQQLAFDLPGENEEDMYTNLLYDLQGRFETLNRTMDDFNLETPPPLVEHDPGKSDCDKASEEYATMYARADDSQKEVLDYCDEKLDEYIQTGVNSGLFIVAPAGYGKTEVARAIGLLAWKKDLAIFNSGSTGLNSLNLHEGSTFHWRYGVPVSDEPQLSSKLSAESPRIRGFLGAVHLHDEAPNNPQKNINCALELLRDIAANNGMRQSPFGCAALFVFIGDFQQIPPVVEGSNDEYASTAASIKNSDVWHHLTVKRLRVNHRQHEDPEYGQELERIGQGLSGIPKEMVPFPMDPSSSAVYCPCDTVENVEKAVQFVFPSLENEMTVIDDEIMTSAYLATTNKAVDEANSYVQSRLPGDLQELLSSDHIGDAAEGETGEFTKDFLDSINGDSAPPHTLHLKERDYVMLIRNYSAADKLMNGTKLQILSTPRSCKGVGLLVRCLETGEKHFIPRIYFTIQYRNKRRNVVTFKLLRRQYPVRLCYSMTINKSMGQTLRKVAIDLRSPVFSHGQLYVAAGRVTKREDARVLPNPNHLHNEDGRQLLLNKVYRPLVHM